MKGFSNYVCLQTFVFGLLAFSYINLIIKVSERFLNSHYYSITSLSICQALATLSVFGILSNAIAR